jgi:hypothetical protein
MSRRARTTAVALGLTAALGLAFTPVTDPVRDATVPGGEVFAPQLVTVDTPTRADKERLQTLGLDLTEHAGRDYVEVVLHSPRDVTLLRDAGFTWTVRIDDLLARQRDRIALDEAFAAATEVSALPSGRTSYRVLDDFAAEIDQLVADHPDLAKRVSIGTSVEGRDLTGIEIGVDVHAPEDGRPVFLMFGAHHAREWPSAEVPLEFAYDLLAAHTDPEHPDHARVTDLLTRGRAVIVPVSNPDGYDASRTSGDLVDLRTVDRGGLVSILATPGNAYKRKNCRVVDGLSQPAGTCVAYASPGGYGIGIDLNRNYGALWGGPGTDDLQASPIYRGPAPFSEPETQAIRTLISSRQVTTVVTNHTFSNLVLRPVGVEPNTVGPDGYPIGFAPDECFTAPDGDDRGMQALGERMAAQVGYTNQFGWELYDTTGTTEDYSYNATGGYGYTFEIGPHEFHPPFGEVVAEYTGETDAAQAVTHDDAHELTTSAADDCHGHDVEHDTVGGGLRESFLIAFANAVDATTHALVTGVAPEGAVLTVERSGTFPLWDGTPFADTVRTSMTIGATGDFTWHVNPSTRPFVQSRRANILGPALQEWAFDGITPPLAPTVHEVEVEPGATLITFELASTASADDYDLYLYGPDGERLAAGETFGSSERVSHHDVDGLAPGTYTVEVANFAGATQWTLRGGAYAAQAGHTPRMFETWTLSCEVDGLVAGQAPVAVERGETVDVGDVCRAGLAAGGSAQGNLPAWVPPTDPGRGQRG